MEKILENLVKRKEEFAGDFSDDDQDQKTSQNKAITPSSSPSQAPGSSNSAPGSSNSAPGPSSSIPKIDDEETSPFSSVPVMKPDIVFFGEGLPEEFHNSIARDKEKVDLLIVIGSSLKV